VTKEEKKTEKEKKETVLMPQKRKASEELDLLPPQGQGQGQTQIVVLMTTPAKKFKTTPAEQETQEGESKEGEEGVMEEKGVAGSFPNEFFYCHQCSKKRDLSSLFSFFSFRYR
jgi:hypothetical protein